MRKALTQEVPFILVDRACREVPQDRQYTPGRSRNLIRWITSDCRPTSNIAGVAIEALGRPAFDDLLAVTLAQGDEPDCRLVRSLADFDSEHERLLPLLRTWIRSPDEGLKLQCATSIAYVLPLRMENGQVVAEEDVALFRPILDLAAMRNPVVRLHLKAFDRAAGGAA